MISRRQTVQAVHTALTTATGRPAGIGAVPFDQNGSTLPPPYYVIDLITFTTSGAPYADLNEDAYAVVQIRTVSGPSDGAARGTAPQAQLWADRAAAALLGRDPDTGAWTTPITVPGAAVISRALDTDMGESSDASAAIVSYDQRIRLHLTPAT